MGFFRATIVETKYIPNTKLAKELRKQWALLRMTLDWVCQLDYNFVWKYCYSLGIQYWPRLQIRDIIGACCKCDKLVRYSWNLHW